jgi:hypothetical protein
MKLKDFPYVEGKDRAEYSCLITWAIYAACKYEIIPNRSFNERKGFGDNEDRLAYWGTTTTISFGRYLVYDPDGKNIKFWLGLYRDPSKDAPQFIIWFRTRDIDHADIEKLEKKFKLPSAKTKPELPIPLDDPEFKMFCNGKKTCEDRRDIIKNFLDRVLGTL